MRHVYATAVAMHVTASMDVTALCCAAMCSTTVGRSVTTFSKKWKQTKQQDNEQ